MPRLSTTASRMGMANESCDCDTTTDHKMTNERSFRHFTYFTIFFSFFFCFSVSDFQIILSIRADLLQIRMCMYGVRCTLYVSILPLCNCSSVFSVRAKDVLMPAHHPQNGTTKWFGINECCGRRNSSLYFTITESLNFDCLFLLLATL